MCVKVAVQEHPCSGLWACFLNEQMIGICRFAFLFPLLVQSKYRSFGNNGSDPFSDREGWLGAYTDVWLLNVLSFLNPNCFETTKTELRNSGIKLCVGKSSNIVKGFVHLLPFLFTQKMNFFNFFFFRKCFSL